MQLSQILTWSEEFTDEVQTEGFALAFANRAISEINTEAGLLLPMIETLTDEYTALPASWFVRFLVDYLNFGVKMNDASITEAMIYKQNFDVSLMKFKDVARSIIDEEFVDPNSPRTYTMDSTDHIDLGWFNGGGGGW